MLDLSRLRFTNGEYILVIGVARVFSLPPSTSWSSMFIVPWPAIVIDICIDPETREIWRAAKVVWRELIQPVVIKSFRDAYPDDNERHAFAQRVLVDFDSHNYHMYSIMYVPHNHSSTSLLPHSLLV